MILSRLLERSSNRYGKSDEERAQVLKDLRDIEPLLRRTASAAVDTTQPIGVVADRILAAVRPGERTSP